MSARTTFAIVFCVSLILLVSGCINQGITEKNRTDVKTYNGTKTPLNFMGHWLTEDTRETLVRETVREFSVQNPDIDVNLKFHQEILGVRSKEETAKLIVKMIKTNNISWDIVWMDDHIYQLVAEGLNDTDWGRKNLVDFTDIPGFRETQKPFIFSDPSYI